MCVCVLYVQMSHFLWGLFCVIAFLFFSTPLVSDVFVVNGSLNSLLFSAKNVTTVFVMKLLLVRAAFHCS